MACLRFIFMKGGDLPPVCGVPQAPAARCCCRRDLVKGAAETELQHSVTIRGGGPGGAVTGPRVHDKLIALKFAPPIFRVRHSDCSANGAAGLNDLTKMVVTVARTR